MFHADISRITGKKRLVLHGALRGAPPVGDKIHCHGTIWRLSLRYKEVLTSLLKELLSSATRMQTLARILTGHPESRGNGHIIAEIGIVYSQRSDEQFQIPIPFSIVEGLHNASSQKKQPKT